MEKAITLTREELYEKVWTQPVRTVAAQFHISDVALAKRCRKLDIPLPGLGYWAKVAAGQKPRRKALPSRRGTIPPAAVFEPPKPPTEPTVLSPVVAEIAAMEQKAESKIVVPEALRRPHALVQQTLLDLKQQKQKSSSWSWQTSRRLDIDVSAAQFERALLIMDTILKAIEQRGWSATIVKEDYRSKSCVELLGQRVPFGIRERIKKVENEPAKSVRGYDGKPYTPHQSRYRDEPSGRLSLVIRARWKGMTAIEKSWDDTSTGHIEDQLNAFLTGIALKAEEWNEWDRRRDANERASQEAARARAEEQQRREAEGLRRRQLEQEAQRWMLSNNIRAYLSAVHSEIERLAIEPEPKLATWLDWAAAHAENIDPLPTRVVPKAD